MLIPPAGAAYLALAFLPASTSEVPDPLPVEARGGGYFRPELPPLILRDTDINGVSYYHNLEYIRFQRANASWGALNYLMLFENRTRGVASYSGPLSPVLSPTAGDELVLPPEALVLASTGSLSGNGYLNENEAIILGCIPFEPVKRTRTYMP